MSNDEFATEIQIRYGDLDALGHVNNAIFLTYYELARINFLKRFSTDVSSNEFSIVIARAEVDFIKPIKFRDTVTVGTKVLKTGRTSITFQHRIYDDAGTIYSRAVIIGVFVDRNGKPVNIPQKIIEFLDQTGVVT